MGKAQKSTFDKSGNTNTDLSDKRRRRWIIVINNYTEKEFFELKDFGKKGLWIIGKEIGKECKTPHLQCYFKLKNPVGFDTIKRKFPRAHIEIARGSDDANIDYCSKDGDYCGNFPRLKKEVLIEKYYSSVQWKDWQNEIIELVKTPPDARSIYWYFDKKGNIGKSFLCKYLACKYKIILCSGKTTDVFNQVKSFIDEYGEDPKLIICDIPRSSLEYINYTCLEKLKDGMLYSGKYEGGLCIFDHPHVIVFANEKPDISALSSDRWKIKEV